MTLRQLVRQIITDLSGGDISRDTPYNENYVAQRVRFRLNGLLKLTFFEKYAEGDKTPINTYIWRYEKVPVQKGDKSLFIDLPVVPVTLPHDKGVWKVYPENNPYESFIPRHNVGITSILPAGRLQGKRGYWRVGKKIFFDNNQTPIVKEVDVELIIAAPETLGLDEDLPATPEVLSECIQLVKQDVAKMILEDTIDNSKVDVQS
jgi:hypothetical protein